MKTLDDVFNETVEAGGIDFSQKNSDPAAVFAGIAFPKQPAEKKSQALSLSEVESRPVSSSTPDLTPQVLTMGMSLGSRSPDETARDNQIIQKSGMPSKAFDYMTPERAQAVRALGDTPENFVKEFPLSSKVLSNSQVMAIAKDDVRSLQTLETVLGSLESNEEDDGYGSDQDDNAGNTDFRLRRRLGGVVSGLDAAAPAVAEGFDGLMLAGLDTLMEVLNIHGPTAQAMRDKIDAWRQTNADIKENLTKEAQDAFDSELAKLAVSGVVSGGQNLLTLGTAAALSAAGTPITVGTLALGMMGLSAMGASYGEAKDEGLNTALSVLHGVANGSLEVATEKLGLDALIKMGKASGVKEMLRLGKNYLLGEHAGEQINTFLGDLESWMLIDGNKGKTFNDYLNERGRRAFETAVITTVGGGVQMGGAAAFNTALRASQVISESEMEDLRKKQGAGVRSQELMNTITELTNNSKIAMRSPESMPQIVSEMIGEKVPFAYLPAEVLNQSGMEDLLLQSAPELSEEIESSKKSGADVKIPIETMARLTQNEAVNKAISQEVKFSPDELNARQAQERTSQLGADIEARLEQEMKAMNPTRAEEIQKIASNISEQLIATGMRGEEARANGQIHAAFFNTMAALMGVSPTSLAQKYGINIAQGVNEVSPGSGVPNVPMGVAYVPSVSVKPAASKGEAIKSGADLQNRDRAKGSSIAQMRNIASNLQYGLVGPGHNLGNDAPIVSYGSIPKNQFGAEDYVIAGKGTQKIPVRYAVVDASEIQTSNDPSTGAWNESYGNQGLINAVIGNGRLSAMKLAYAENMAEGYKTDFSSDTSHGIDPSVIAAVKNPVLVRVIDPKYVTKELIDESNNSSVQRMSPAEVAKNDARVLDLDSLRFDADGSPTSESIYNFVKWLDPNEAAGLIDDKGRVTRQATDRLNAAIFAKAYEDDRLVSMYAEAEDPESRLIISALARIAPQAARLEGKGDLDIRSALIDAVNQIIQGRKKYYKLSDIAKQTDMFADPDMATFIELFALNPRSTRAAVDILWNAIESAADSVDNLDTSSGSLFDDVPAEEPMSRAQLMEMIRNELEQAKAQKETLNQDANNRIKTAELVINNCVTGTPVVSLSGEEFNAGSGKLHDAVEQFYKEQFGGKVENPDLGEIILNRKAVKDSASHGLGRNKATAFAAVPHVLQQGEIFDHQKNWKNRSYDTYVLASPIEINQKKFVCEVIAIDTGIHKRFYLHEVTPIEDIVAATIQDPYRRVKQPQPVRPVRSILVQRYLESKKDDNAQKLPVYARPDNSRPSHDTVAPEKGRPAAGEFSDLGNAEVLENKKNKVKDDFYQSPIPTDRLITVHNISEENLNKALDLGGFAAPSLGITKQTTSYTDFGDISLIGTKNMVDPKSGTPVFSQDAYTQTFPEPVWDRSVNEEGAKVFNEKVQEAAKESGFTDEPNRFIYNLRTTPNKDGIVKQLLISKIGAYMFLKEKGVEVDVSKDSRDYGYGLKDKANEYRDEFESWADKFAGQAFDAPMIEVKGKLKPITLENVVEAMRSNLVRNKEGTMTFGAGKIRAAAAKQFGSMEEIQSSRNQITDSKTANQQNTVTNEKLDSYRALVTKEYQGDSFDAIDEAMAALAKVAGLKSKPTEARVKAALKKKGFEPSDETVKLGVEILNDIKASMTDYFEAKPQRAVGLDEFRGAVVPERTSEATIKRLEDAGLTVVKYGDEEGARIRAVQDLTTRLNEKSGDVLYQGGGTQESREAPLVRDGIIRKGDDETATVVTISEGSAPNFEKMQDFSDWAKSILQSGGDVTIQSTGHVARFTAKNIKASTKRSRSKVHRDAYPALRKLIESAEYDHYEPADERHPNSEGQDVYYSALQMGEKLYSVKIKLDVVTEKTKDVAKQHGNEVGDVNYKDHKLVEIEIAPTLYRTTPSLTETAHSQQDDAIKKVSLGVLRGNVNPSRIRAYA